MSDRRRGDQFQPITGIGGITNSRVSWWVIDGATFFSIKVKTCIFIFSLLTFKYHIDQINMHPRD